MALIRLAIPLVVWAEWGYQLILPSARGPGDVAIGLSVFASTLLLFVGFWSRISALLCAVSLTSAIYFLGHVAGRDFVHHHTHLMMLSTWLLALTPCGGSYSIDRLLAVQRARRGHLPVPLEHGALWGQRLLCVLVTTVYLWSAFEKRWPAFTSGARLEQLFMTFYGSSEYPEWAHFHAAMVITSWLSIGIEIFVALGLWVPRLRPAAIATGIVFHLCLYLALPVSTFSVLMVLLYVVFMDPGRVHRFIEDLSGHHQM